MPDHYLFCGICRECYPDKKFTSCQICNEFLDYKYGDGIKVCTECMDDSWEHELDVAFCGKFYEIICHETCLNKFAELTLGEQAKIVGRFDESISSSEETSEKSESDETSESIKSHLSDIPEGEEGEEDEDN